MRSLPKNRLDPRIKNVWRISDGIWIVLVFACCFLPFLAVCLIDPQERWAYFVCLGILAVFAFLVILFLFVLPPIRYARWRYELSNEYLEIAKGIIWRKHYVIPFIRVQNTDTRQGPILRAFKLASVTVSTAAGSHEIPGLDFETAESLRDHAAELARIAREDV